MRSGKRKWRDLTGFTGLTRWFFKPSAVGLKFISAFIFLHPVLPVNPAGNFGLTKPKRLRWRLVE
jgi:hypothetical protein